MGEISYRPLIEDMTWSFSRLNSFSSCPYEWYLHYIMGNAGEEQFYASYGSFVHELIAEFYNGELKKEDLADAFQNRFSSEVLGRLPNEKIVESYKNSGLRYFQTFEPLPFTPISVEREIFFTINKTKFHGFLDFLGQNEQGGFVIVDHKSKALNERSKRKKKTKNDEEIDKLLTQLYVYAAGVEENYGEPPVELCLNCFRSGILIREPFDKAVFEKTKAWVEERVEEISSEEDFPAYEDWFYCEWICGQHDLCERYQENKEERRRQTW